MNTKISKLSIAMAAVALVGMAAVYPSLSQADKRLRVWMGFDGAGATNSDCMVDASPNRWPFVAEGTAEQSIGINCQLTSAGATATTSCAFGTRHRARMASFNGSNLQYRTPGSASDYSTTPSWSANWTDFTSTHHTQIAHGNCPAGVRIIANTQGWN